MSYFIKKVKLDDKAVTVSYYDTAGNDIVIKGGQKYIGYMYGLFRRLVPFFADLSEQKEADSIDWDNIESLENDELLSKLTVNQLVCNNSNAAAVMSGVRYLSVGGKILSITCPAIETESMDWELLPKYEQAVNEVLDEVNRYIEQRLYEDVPSLFPEETDPFKQKELVENIAAN